MAGCLLWANSGHIRCWQESPNSWPEISGRGRHRYRIGCQNYPVVEMKKKSLLHYELYGTSARGDKKGYWRWAIFAGHEEKPVEAGSFYGTLEEAKEHAEDTISSLKQRARTRRLAQNS